MRKTLLALLLLAFPAFAQTAHDIDTAQSRLTVFAYKTGMFSFAAHDHEISAPIASGRVDESDQNPSVMLRVNTREMKVLDPKASAKDRAEIQRDMETKVLAIEQFSAIDFASTRVTRNGTDHWTVIGNLTIHGQTKSVTVSVAKTGARYTGDAKLKQTEFGITPISVAGGTVKVKDEIKITFDIALK